MSYCADIWITPSTFERNVISYWRTCPGRYSSYKKAIYGYLDHVQRILKHAEYLESLNRQPVLTDYS